MSLRCERLEERLLLAVNVSQKGSTLVVEYDAGGDADLTLTGTGAGAIDVTNATTGNDSYTGIRNIKIVGGSGDDDVQITDVQIAGNLTADTKGGGDFINIEGDIDIGGNVKVKLGAGDDDLEIDSVADEVPMNIGKSLSVDFGDAETNGDYFELIGFNAGQLITVGGSVTLKGQDGQQDMYISGCDIAKNLKVDVGGGNDELKVGTGQDNADAVVIVRKSTTFKLGDGDDLLLLTPALGTLDFQKNLTIDLGGAETADQLTLFADNDDDQFVHVGGNVSIKGAGGTQSLDLDGFDVEGNVKVSLGDADDSIAVSQGGGESGAEIGKNLDVRLGDGEEDELLVERLTIGGNAKIDGGDGDNDNADETAGGLLVIDGSTSSKNFETGDLVV